VRTAQETSRVGYVLYREIIAVRSQIHTKHINTLCGQNVEFFNFTVGCNSIIIMILYILDLKLKLITFFINFISGISNCLDICIYLLCFPGLTVKKRKQSLFSK
jgi:hypothetical protein